MKRIFLALAVAIISIAAFAQTQQGIVKTRGRMVNGQLVPGVRLSGATITLNVGNPLVSGSQGTFSFPVPSGRTYALVNAQKQGYTLADPDYTRRSFKYSAQNPFYVVLEDEKQRQADINAATKNVRRTLIAQLQAREDEIESLKEQNKLSEEEYQKRLQELYDNQSKSEQLVKEMAERYASTDYDQLDEFNRQVQLYIEEGELQKADSMIRSKGNMEQRVAEYQNVVAANRKVRKELEQSETGAARTYEDISQDLYRRHEIFMQEFKPDSALYCMKLRADMDTSNIEACFQYAYLAYKCAYYQQAEKYFLTCLAFNLSGGDSLRISTVQDNLGIIYCLMGDFQKSEYYLSQALSYREKRDLSSLDAFYDLVKSLNNIGLLYMTQRNYSMARDYLERLQELARQHPSCVPVEPFINLGGIYTIFGEYEKAESCYQETVLRIQQLSETNADAYRPQLAMVLENMGTMYYDLDNFEKADSAYTQCLSNRRILFAQNEYTYLEELSRILTNMGNLYLKYNETDKAEPCYKEAILYKEQLFQRDSVAYRLTLSHTLNGLGQLYCDCKEYELSEQYYQQSLSHVEYLYNQAPDVYLEDLSLRLHNFGVLYRRMQDDARTIEYYSRETECNRVLYGKYPDVYAGYYVETLAALSEAYLQTGDLSMASDAIEEAIAAAPDDAVSHEIKGAIYLLQGKEKEALKMWKKVLELNPDFLNDYPEGTNLSNGLKERGLIK